MRHVGSGMWRHVIPYPGFDTIVVRCRSRWLRWRFLYLILSYILNANCPSNLLSFLVGREAHGVVTVEANPAAAHATVQQYTHKAD